MMNITRMTSKTIPSLRGIYLGERGEAFKTLITSVLKKGRLKKKYINILTSPSSMKEYGAAFTSEMIDPRSNYQVYEQLGDLTGNKFIVWYIYKRFPQLRCAEGVKVAARLRINYGSKNSFYQIAHNLGFWDFISAPHDLRQRKMKPLLEDVFEAFLGVTETILDDEVVHGVGYASVYKILKVIFDEMDISLRYEDLYDSKTRLKELFDIYQEELGPLVYEEEKDNGITYSTAYRYEGGQYEVRPNGTVNTKRIIGPYHKVKLGQGAAPLKADAQQAAATQALKTLAQQGYVKKAPRIYARFMAGDQKTNNKTTERDVLRIIDRPENINEQFPTRGKSRYQCKYTSPIIAHFCRERDEEGVRLCLQMGADVNILDSEGLSPLDLLLIGSVEEKKVKSIAKLLLSRGTFLFITPIVRERYLSMYEGKFFRSLNDSLKDIVLEE